MKLIILIVTTLVAVNENLGSYIENLQEKQSNDGLSDQIPQEFAGAFAISLGLSLLPSSINVISGSYHSNRKRWSSKIGFDLKNVKYQ